MFVCAFEQETNTRIRRDRKERFFLVILVMASDTDFHVPDLEITESLLERVQFSVSSRNAESKICETVAHIFGSPMVVSPRAIDWSYITTGIIALLRNKELVKKKYVWSLSLCIYNIEYGVLVWKGSIPLDCNYTDVSDNFHVLALEDGQGILGIIFQDPDASKPFCATVTEWITEGLKDEKGKPPPEPPKIKFRKEMISKPCNFQHIQGSQAIDECIEIERIKGQILASLASFKLKDSTDNSSLSKPRQSKSKKKEAPKPIIPFKEIEIPSMRIDRVQNETPTNGIPNGAPSTSEQYQFQTTPPLSHTTSFPPEGGESGGSGNSQASSHLGRLSPLNLEEEIIQSFAFTSHPTGYDYLSTTTS